MASDYEKRILRRHACHSPDGFFCSQISSGESPERARGQTPPFLKIFSAKILVAVGKNSSAPNHRSGACILPFARQRASRPFAAGYLLAACFQGVRVVIL